MSSATTFNVPLEKPDPLASTYMSEICKNAETNKNNLDVTTSSREIQLFSSTWILSSEQRKHKVNVSLGLAVNNH